MNKIITSESGGLSGIHFSDTLTKQPGESVERSAKWGERQVKDMTNIHPEEEVFLLGNLYALKGLAAHLFRGLIGLVAGLCTLGGAWVGSQKVRQMTADLTKIPADLLKSLPGVGNLFAAHCNKTAFNEVSTKEAAQASESNLFYQSCLKDLPNIKFFLSEDNPFPELRRLAFAHRKDKTTNPQLEETLKKLVSQIPIEKLHPFLVNERGPLEQNTPPVLWKVCREVAIKKIDDKLKSADDDTRKLILEKLFELFSLEELTNNMSRLVNVHNPSVSSLYRLTEAEDSPRIPPSIWMVAIMNHLATRYPEGKEKDYLATLPKDYLEKLSKNNGLDPLRWKRFEPKDILSAIEVFNFNSWLKKSSLDELVKLRKMINPKGGVASPATITEGASEIAPEIWTQAVKQELRARYPDREKYLQALPRAYREVLFKDGGIDHLSEIVFTKDEILTALSSSMGSMGSLADADWEANLHHKE